MYAGGTKAHQRYICAPRKGCGAVSINRPALNDWVLARGVGPDRSPPAPQPTDGLGPDRNRYRDRCPQRSSRTAPRAEPPLLRDRRSSGPLSLMVTCDRPGPSTGGRTSASRPSLPAWRPIASRQAPSAPETTARRFRQAQSTRHNVDQDREDDRHQDGEQDHRRTPDATAEWANPEGTSR